MFGTDGAWNVMSPEGAIAQVKEIEANNENYMLDPGAGHTWKNPAKHLVESALGRLDFSIVRICSLRKGV